MKKKIFLHPKSHFGTDPQSEPDPHLHHDQLVRGTDPRTRDPYPDPYQNVTDPEHCL
jgi:hypothetical protein